MPRIIKVPSIYSKLLAEFIGTFFLTLTISLTVQNINYSSSSSIHPALVIGLVLSGLIFAFGQYSQAHFNPAVTFVIAFCFKPNNNFSDKPLLDETTAFFYVIIQVLAALAGSSMGIYLSPFNEDAASRGETTKRVFNIVPFAKPISDTASHIWKAWVAELFWTFILVVVILCVGFPSQKSQKGNQFYAFAIGMVVMGGIVCTGTVSGAAFNPAVATGLAASYCFTNPPDEKSCGGTALKFLWIYWTACPFGGFLATLANSVLMSSQKEVDEEEQQGEMDRREPIIGDVGVIPQPTSPSSNTTTSCVIECKAFDANDDEDENENDGASLLRKRGCAITDDCKEGEDCYSPQDGDEETAATEKNSSKGKKGCEIPGLGRVQKVKDK